VPPFVDSRQGQTHPHPCNRTGARRFWRNLDRPSAASRAEGWERRRPYIQILRQAHLKVGLYNRTSRLPLWFGRRGGPSGPPARSAHESSLTALGPGVSTLRDKPGGMNFVDGFLDDLKPALTSQPGGQR